MTEIDAFDPHLTFMFLLFGKMSGISVYQFDNEAVKYFSIHWGYVQLLNLKVSAIALAGWTSCFSYCGFCLTIILSSA